MSDTKRELSIRLSADGGADVTNTFRQLGTAGQQAFDGIGKSADSASGNLDQLDRKLAETAATARQSATTLQQQINSSLGIGAAPANSAQDSANAFRYSAAQQAAQQASAAQAAQAQFNSVLGVGGVSAGSAAASAAVFEEERKAMEVLDAEAAALIARFDPLTAAQAKYAAGVDSANKLLAAGKITTEQHATALTGEQAALDATTRLYDPLNTKLKLSYTNVEILRSGIINTAQSLAAGMDPLQTFTTQLFQTAPVLGEVATQTGLGATALLALGGAAAITVGGLGLLAVAYEKGSAQAAEFNNALVLSGNAAGLTAGGFDKIVDAATQASNIGAGAARSIGDQMAATGKISADVIGQLLAMTADFAAAEKTDAATAGKDLTALFADPQKALQTLDAGYNLLSGAERQHIQNLIDQGSKTQAQIELADALNTRIKNLSTDGMGILEKTWTALGRAADASWDSMLGIGRGATLEEQLAKAQTILAGAGVGGGRGNLAGGTTKPQAQAEVDRIQSEIDAQNLKAADDARAASFKTLDKELQDAGAQYDTFNQKQRDLTNETLKWQGVIDELAKGERIAGSASEEQQYATALTTAQQRQASAKAALAALMTPAQQTRQQLDDQAGINALPAYLRGPQQAYNSTLRQDQQSPDQTIRDQAEAHAQDVKTQAILQQNQAINDQNTAANLNHDLALTVADAWSKGQAAGTDADAARQAALDHLNSGIDVTTRKLQILQSANDDALIAASKQASDLQQQNDSQDLILEAAQNGPAAEQAAQLNAQIATATKDARSALQSALGSGQADEAKTLAAAIERVSDGLAHAAGNAKAIDLTHSLQGQADQVDLLQKQIDLVGENTKAQAVGLAQAQAEIDLRKQGIDVLSAEGQEYIKNADNIAGMNTELERQRSIANELPQFFGQAFDRIGSDLTNLAVTTGSWGDAFKSVENIGLGVLSELEQEAFKLMAINPIENWLNGDNALPTAEDFLNKFLGGLGGGGGISNPDLGNINTGTGMLGHAAAGGYIEVGEHGPEKFYPGVSGTVVPTGTSLVNDRMWAAADAAKASQPAPAGTDVVINNYGNDQATATRSKGLNQKELITIVIGEVSKDIAAGGKTAQAVQGRFALSKTPGVTRG